MRPLLLSLALGGSSVALRSLFYCLFLFVCSVFINMKHKTLALPTLVTDTVSNVSKVILCRTYIP
jgi:hypothetical protein